MPHPMLHSILHLRICVPMVLWRSEATIECGCLIGLHGSMGTHVHKYCLNLTGMEHRMATWRAAYSNTSDALEDRLMKLMISGDQGTIASGCRVADAHAPRKKVKKEQDSSTAKKVKTEPKAKPNAKPKARGSSGSTGGDEDRLTLGMIVSGPPAHSSIDIITQKFARSIASRDMDWALGT
jgi:hypothetical protein